MAIRATRNDVVLSGHGCLQLDELTTTVPPGVRFCLLSPPGAVIDDEVGGALESGSRINSLVLFKAKYDEDFGRPRIVQEIPYYPNWYDPGKEVPNYTLRAADARIRLRPRRNGPQVMIVPSAGSGQTRLEQLWPQVEEWQHSRKRTIQCFWAACTDFSRSAYEDLVYYDDEGWEHDGSRPLDPRDDQPWIYAVAIKQSSRRQRGRRSHRAIPDRMDSATEAHVDWY